MVVEYIRYKVASERQREFEDAWGNAEEVLQEATQCLGYEVSHGVEEPENCVVRIEWRSVQEHEHGFRKSAEFARFFETVKPFLDQIEEMRHYVPTGIVSASRTATSTRTIWPPASADCARRRTRSSRPCKRSEVAGKTTKPS